MKNILLTFILLAAVSCSRPSEPEEEHHAPAAAGEPAAIEMSAEAQSHIGLQVAPVERKALTEYLSVTGTVQPIDSKVIHIRPLSAGKLTSVLCESRRPRRR